MAQTTFVPGTVITKEWLNAVDALRYGQGNSAKGSALLQFIQSGSNKATRNVQDKLQGIWVSPDDFNLASDTLNVQAAFDSGYSVVFERPYDVTQVEYSGTGTVDFAGHYLMGTATSATDCVFKISSVGATLIDVEVRTGVADTSINDDYTCMIWWYDADDASQHNKVFGMKLYYGVRGLVYGELPGSSSTAEAQSENAIYGFDPRGVQNPFYGNHTNGFLDFFGPSFIALNNEWPVSPVFNWTTARAFENIVGSITVHGGELIKTGSALGYAAALSTCRFVGTYIELASPLNQTGYDIHFDGCRFGVTRDDTSAFYTAAAVGATGTVYLNNCIFSRAAGTGVYSDVPLFDATAGNAANTITINNCHTEEWRWSPCSPFVPIFEGGTFRVSNTTIVQTAGDPTIYYDNTTAANLLESKIDHLGYTTTGWTLGGAGVGATLTVTTQAGPISAANYLPKQLTLHGTGTGANADYATNADPTNTTTLNNTALRVHPGEMYLVSAWIYQVSGTSTKLAARFYDLTGTYISNSNAADSTTGFSAAWKYYEGYVIVPATAAWMGVGIQCDVTDARITNLKVRRASLN